jgi:cell division septation protein DedD
MLKIDNSLLEEVGLGGLPDSEKNSFLKHIYETLEMRVGVRLADQMTNQQLDEFEQYFEAKDDAGAFQWLETNFPNYKDIVQQEFDKLKAEITQTAPQILAASQAHAAQAVPAQTQQAAAFPPPTPPADDGSQAAAPPPPPQPPYPTQQPPAGPTPAY